MSAAHGVEIRFPFLTKELTTLALTMPHQYKANETTVKVALRKAALNHLPEVVANRKKLGMPSPLALWMREDRYYHQIRAKFNSDVAHRFFNIKEIMKLLEVHRKGKKSNMTKIWSIYTFIIWYEIYFEKNGVV
jgi:asparagine synthase (glutamine-hydrolysing)